jgi:uncharacterized protein
MVAVLDSAQAVPLVVERESHVVPSFGDPSVEVPRRSLTSNAIGQLLELEIGSRHLAAVDFIDADQLKKADELREETKIISTCFL